MFVKFTCPLLFLRMPSICTMAGMAFLGLGMPASAQEKRTEIPAKSTHSAYLQDGGGLIVRSGAGLCWRSGYWLKEDAVAGCDGPIAPPVEKMIAPPVISETAPAMTADAVSAPIPTRTVAAPCEFSGVLEGDRAFAFNSAELNAPARQQLEQEVLPRLNQCPGDPTMRVTGHTDRLGSASYNRQLSLRRAKAVAVHFEKRDLGVRIEIMGLGASQARQKCEVANGRENVLACLAPDRRVEIHVSGTPN